MGESLRPNSHTSLSTRGSWSLNLFARMRVWNRSQSKESMSTINTLTHTKVHTLYLFDIVACLCTCLNKQNIHLFRSLFSLLCGYLSVMSQESPRTKHKHPWGQAQNATDIDKKTRGKKIQTVIKLKGTDKPCPFLLLLRPLLRTKCHPVDLRTALAELQNRDGRI